MYTAIVATSLTLTAFVRQRLETDPLLKPLFDPISGGTMVVTLNNPEDMQKNAQQGLSVWLYRVIRDEDTLNLPLQRIAFDQVRETPLPIKCHFLVTPVADANPLTGAEVEQTVLGKVMQSLYDHTTFRGADLKGDLTGTSAELHARLEPMTVEEITRVWHALERSYRLSVSYEVGIVDIRSERVDDVSPVLEAIPEYGVIVATS
jgi:hypothetical protein